MHEEDGGCSTKEKHYSFCTSYVKLIWVFSEPGVCLHFRGSRCDKSDPAI